MLAHVTYVYQDLQTPRTCLLSYLPHFLPKEFLVFLDGFFQFFHSGFGLLFTVFHLFSATGGLG